MRASCQPVALDGVEPLVACFCLSVCVFVCFASCYDCEEITISHKIVCTVVDPSTATCPVHALPVRFLSSGARRKICWRLCASLKMNIIGSSSRCAILVGGLLISGQETLRTSTGAFVESTRDSCEPERWQTTSSTQHSRILDTMPLHVLDLLLTALDTDTGTNGTPPKSSRRNSPLGTISIAMLSWCKQSAITRPW